MSTTLSMLELSSFSVGYIRTSLNCITFEPFFQFLSPVQDLSVYLGQALVPYQAADSKAVERLEEA